MAQNTDINIEVIRYTRTDYTALRAVMNKVALSIILDRYYCDDDRELLGLETPADLRSRMDKMRDHLIERASDTLPHLAIFLQDARRTSIWSKKAIDYLVNAADQEASSPRPNDHLSFWFKRRFVEKIASEEQCKTVMDLANLINIRGSIWHLPIPRVGKKTARIVEQWFFKNSHTCKLIDKKRLEPAPPVKDMVLIDLQSTVLVPLEKMALSAELDGRHGINRGTSLCMIEAKNDLEAVKAYLAKFEGKIKTHRSYQKEIERFLLWCVRWRKKPLSSVLGQDCISYTSFIDNPDREWIGHRKKRFSEAWRPFTGKMAPSSQRYAIRILRYFFTWLVDIRYLNGNPWVAVDDPVVNKLELAMQIDKALPADLWRKLAEADGILDSFCTMSEEEIRIHFKPYGPLKTASITAQARLIRAAIVLMGETGLRRDEAARASRDKLQPIHGSADLWELKVLGKGRKERTVTVPLRVIEVLKSHWKDRNADFEYGMATLPLLSPVVFPDTTSTNEKHLDDQGNRLDKPFTTDGLGRLVSKALKAIANSTTISGLEPEDRASLQQAAAHALRHTFGTLAVADEMPLDVVQKLLGHVSLQTTTIYVQAEKKRMIEESAKRQARRSRQTQSAKQQSIGN